MVPLVIAIIEVAVVSGWLLLFPLFFLFAQVGTGHDGGLLYGVFFYML